jgi:hypothetical protein
MADLKISALPASTTPLAGAEVLPIVQSGVTRQVSVANLTAGRAISATAVTASTGNFIVGTSGQGIDFSATPGTGTSELLADYEEGAWTPVLSDGVNNATMSGSTQGRYTKIGNTVFYRARVRLTSLGSVSGSVRVTGLPFTVPNLEANYGGGNTIALGSGLNIISGQSVSQIPVNTSTYINLYLWDSTGGSTTLQAAEMSATSDIYFSGQYEV